MTATMPLEKVEQEIDPESSLAYLLLDETPAATKQFIETFFTVPNELGQVVPMMLYPQQIMMLEDETGRDITVKGRQTRASSLKLARRVRRMCFQLHGATCLIGAQDDATTEKFRTRIQHHIKDLQNKGFAIELARDNSDELVIAGMDNHFVFVSAEQRIMGRAFAAQEAHLSEVAHWKESTIGSLLGGLMPALPASPFGRIDLESTPAGEEGTFHDYAMAAKPFDMNDDWSLHFYPWWLEPRYEVSDDPTKGWHYIHPNQLKELTEDFTPSEEEKALMLPVAAGGPGLTVNKILWRRLKMREQNKTTAPFAQEYPEDVLKCWLGKEGRFFDTPDEMDHLDYYRKEERKPLRWMESLPYEGAQISFFGPNLAIWEMPIATDIYAIAFDSASGGIGHGYDYSSIGVWNATKEKRVARIRVQCSPRQLGQMVCAVGAFYGTAMASGERSHHGEAVFEEMKSLAYPNIFYYVDPEKKQYASDVVKPGIYPTEIMRQKILGEFKEGITSHAVQQFDQILNQEMAMFSWEKYKGRLKQMAERKAGSHDDVVMEAANGWFVCKYARMRRQARNRRNEQQDYTVGRGGLIMERTDQLSGAQKPWFR